MAEMTYLFIQEGGSSTERYVHGHDSREEAEQARVKCEEDSYRTSPIIEVPKSLASQEGFYEALENVLRAQAMMDQEELQWAWGFEAVR